MVALPATIDPEAPLPNGTDMLMAASTPAMPNLVPVAPLWSRVDGRIRRATGFRRAPNATRVLQPRHSPRIVHHLPGVPGAIPGQAPRLVRGATRYWHSNDLIAAFATTMVTSVANNNKTPRNNRAMALLSAAAARGQSGPWGARIYAPQADYLQVLNSRLQAEAAFRRQMTATLRARFNEDAADMADGHADIARTITAQQRGWSAPQLRLA